MTPPPPPPTSDPAHAAAATAAPERRPARKRRRLVVSCTECHRRKQKCDRNQPCANCTSRNKASGCIYDAPAKSLPSLGTNESTSSLSQSTSPPALPAYHDGGGGATLSSVAAQLGYAHAGTSTMGFLRHMEAHDPASLPAGRFQVPSRPGGRDTEALTSEKFKGLIRQLPAKRYLDRLVTIFLSTFNYQYYAVDPDVFHAQLQEWQSLPFKLLSTSGPHGLTPDLRVFPAVLFQMVATALLVVPEGDEEMEGLKYAAGMTFEDLAMDYSENGMAIVSLFGKTGLALTTILAEFLRAGFLKYTANVTESWHLISVAIKDAQELGMHRDSLDPKPRDGSAEAALENQWLIERRRKMYLILINWDIAMSTFLGRPGTINRAHGLPTPPVDTKAPVHRSRQSVVPRDEWNDPPTAIISVLWLRELQHHLFDVADLEQDGPRPKDYSKVDAIHERMVATEERKPAILRVVNPDTRWDHEPETAWVQHLRYHFAGLYAFNLMVLHRPYIFHRKKSRHEALKASLQILEMGRCMFHGLPPDHWRNYHLFFGSFDAIVLLSTIFMVFPQEHEALRQNALQQFQWTLERFSAMQERNPLARSAQGVLKAILAKLTKALNMPLPSSQQQADALPTTPASVLESNPFHPKSVNEQTPLAFAHSAPSTDGADDVAPVECAAHWTTPDNLAAMAPMYPTYDLLFNDLSVTTGPFDSMTIMDNPHPNPWHFGGGFGEDTVWTLLNQYPYGQQQAECT
ncbi:uncharacterized protein F5Z01DRAFT_633099 [Emericellopsis atlantica]|uniref:Zn(2)-C6 fungal-type domain-containing protein n=1 Tax=Emericellopsis atlantica TaxID=2614577 RepID=A0A9P7ZTR1_9HYPO|nr:uncharacterized protein F5Z01DRAFT_633099 [Emericellopsis atlantica]KAG9258100.1 hypothetical protein F5Z01DRAFT_633099 [Emericellopsis atlantica]